MIRKPIRRAAAAVLALMMGLSMTACVNQHPDSESAAGTKAASQKETDAAGETGTDGAAEAGGSTAAESASGDVRVVATTPSIMKICDMLEIDLVGIPDTSSEIPERYQSCTKVGMAMNPDLEIISSLDPTDVLMTGGGSGGKTTSSMIPGQDSKLSSADLPVTYLDVSSVEGLYDTIEQLGEKYGKQELAKKYVDEYHAFLDDYQKKLAGKESPKVLILMGLPGSYIEATPNSYVGALVEMAGGTNVVSDDSGEAFLTWNTEQLYELDPDYILLTAHGIPEQAMEMFSEEFTTNTIWQNFRAVQEGHVYQLDYTIFNMSATFDWTTGLDELYQMFYEGSWETYQPAEAES